ncbi:MAG: hypothetical protein PHQ75_04135 [Thermoguttaceae bacterium]|nr:hypothetical protein [Thermoguttaceae bacterium]
MSTTLECLPQTQSILVPAECDDNYKTLCDGLIYDMNYSGLAEPQIREVSCITTEMVPVVTVPEKLAAITSTFKFRTTELAEILHVERQTIYAWIREENEPFTSTIEHIDQLVRLADYWESLSSLPLSHQCLLDRSSGEESFFDLFHNMTLEDKIRERLYNYYLLSLENNRGRKRNSSRYTKGNPVAELMIPTVSIRDANE